jgi:hypothetical protein
LYSKCRGNRTAVARRETHGASEQTVTLGPKDDKIVTMTFKAIAGSGRPPQSGNPRKFGAQVRAGNGLGNARDNMKSRTTSEGN